MNRLSLRGRLLLLSAIPMVALVAVAAMSLWIVRHGTSSMKTVYQDRVIPMEQLKTVGDMYAVNIVDTAHQARDGAKTFEQARASIEAARAAVSKQWKDYTSTYLIDAEKRAVERARVALARADVAVDRLLAIVAARDRAALAAFAANELYPALDPVATEVAALTRIQIDVVRAEYEEAVEHEALLLFGVGAAIGLALLVGAGSAFWIGRRLLASLGGEPERAVEIARTIASGDLTARVDVRAGDTTSLMAALSAMVGSLRTIVGEVRTGVDQITGAAGEIAAGNQDLSHRTEEQASSLQQTAASMEEMNAAVAQNSGSAREATELAGEASRAAAQGGEVVGRVVTTIGEIAAQSRRIGDIIGVIDGIAFQTNILALNAAVEAARAGEQGRGFAVVASEVRSLAQRSAQAAKEIKTLITDSVEQVAQGSKLAAEAGTAIDEVVRRVHAVDGLIAGIAAASVEQANNVAQVSQAVGQLDTVTQQNAALVEESAAAAESLAEQARTLSQSVSVFRV